MRSASSVSSWRWLVIIGVFALVAAACQPGADTTATTVGEEPTGTTAAPGATGTTAPPAAGAEGFSYAIGIFEDTTTDNYWAYFDPDSTVWNAYVLAPTKAALYGIQFPGIEVTPDVAAEDFSPAEQDGDAWSVTVPMRDDAVWSDGEPITAEDVVFTYETVRDLALGGNWLSAVPLPDPEDPDKIGISAVEAVDDTTVKITFNGEPGLAIWPHSIGLMPIMPQHFWADAVEEAKGSDDPATALYGASGVGEPSAGPVVFESREAGAFARNVANENYVHSGEEVTSGEVTYTEGPFLGEEIFSLYGSQDAAVLALREGEVDFLLNPLGMQRGLRDQVAQDQSLTAVTNPTYGFRYLAFNMRRAPMNIPEFRQALNIMIDKELMANQVLQGVAFPLWTMMPSGNEAWYNEEVANEISEPLQAYESEADRLNAAVELLRGAGFTWETEPSLDDATPPNIVPGQGMVMPDGTPVPELELLTPSAGYDPLRATYGIWIEKWAQDLGIPLTANPTGFNVIVPLVFPESGEPQFDLYILGWSLGNPALPDFYPSFFHSRNIIEVSGGNNSPGYASDAFDAASDAFEAAQTEEEAFEAVWEMERVLAEDLPYIVLFDTPILEFYRSETIAYPFQETLGGFQFIEGMPALVQAAR